MRVLHIISSPAPESAAHQLRLRLKRLPHDSTVAAPGGGPVTSLSLAGGVTVHPLIRAGWFDLVDSHRLRGRARAGRPGRSGGRP